MNKVINLNEVANKNVATEDMNIKKSEETSKVTNENIITAKKEEKNSKILIKGVIEQDCKYVKVTDKEDKVLTNFILNPKEIIKTNEESIMTLEIKTESKEDMEITVKTSDLNSASSFKKVINKKFFGLTFKAKDEEFEDIKEIIDKKIYLNKKGTNITGIVKENQQYFFVSKKGTLNSKGEIDDQIITVEEDEFIKSDLMDYAPITKEELEKIADALFKFNSIDIASTVMGFVGSCFLKERLLQEFDKKLNHLLIIGEAGSGKSATFDNIMKPVFATNSGISASSLTDFAGMKLATSSNLVPCFVNEYKPSQLTTNKIKRISDLLRNGYDGTPGVRGQVTQNIKYFFPITPFVLLGEMGFNETAIIERSLEVRFSKDKRNKENEENYIKLKDNKELLSKLGNSLLRRALEIREDEIKDRINFISESIGVEFKDRIKNSMENAMLGITLIEDIFNNLGLDFKEKTGYYVDEIFLAIYGNVKDNQLNGKFNVHGIIDNTIELFDQMAEQDKLSYGRDYQLINNGKELALNVDRFYDKYLKYINSRGMYEVEKLSLIEFKRQLQFKDYFVFAKDGRSTKTVRFDGLSAINKRACVLNICKLKEQLKLKSII